MDLKKTEFWLSIILIIYLFILGIGAAATIIINFPAEVNNTIKFAENGSGKIVFTPFGLINSSDQGLALIALLAGMAGSFLHAAQSLSSYIGNRSFKISWTTWYILRPWIGGILGITLYFAIRAGVVAGATTVNPYVVAAFGLLGGWFSKTATDKLQEVFETLFKTNQDERRHDKLTNVAQPNIKEIYPLPIPSTANEIIIIGKGFMKGSVVRINDVELQSEFISETTLKVPLNTLLQRPSSGIKASIMIKNPGGSEPLSKEFTITFQ